MGGVHILFQKPSETNLFGDRGETSFNKYCDFERIHTLLAMLNLLCQLLTRIWNSQLCCYHFCEENGGQLFSIKRHHIIVKILRSDTVFCGKNGDL